MKKAFLWFLFVLHSLTLSVYLLLGIFKKVHITQFNLSVLAFGGILTTLSFGEIVIRDIHENRKNRKAD